MNTKQYNNIIEHTLQVNCKENKSSQDTVRTILNNMGVALPQGTIKDIYPIILSNEYMGWKKCTLQEAKIAVNKGIATIGISENDIVVFAAKDDEQPITKNASVITLDETILEDSVSDLVLYQYSNMRSGGNQYGATWNSLDDAMNHYGTDFTYTYCGGYYNYYYSFSDGSRMYFRVE